MSDADVARRRRRHARPVVLFVNLSIGPVVAPKLFQELPIRRAEAAPIESLTVLLLSGLSFVHGWWRTQQGTSRWRVSARRPSRSAAAGSSWLSTSQHKIWRPRSALLHLIDQAGLVKRGRWSSSIGSGARSRFITSCRPRAADQHSALLSTTGRPRSASARRATTRSRRAPHGVRTSTTPEEAIVPRVACCVSCVCRSQPALRQDRRASSQI